MNNIFVLGLGYVGSVVAAGLAKAGHMVTAIDIDKEKIKAFSDGLIKIFEPGLSELVSQGIAKQRLEFKYIDDIEEINAPIVMICVGTPSRIDGAADLSQVKVALQWIVKRVIRSGSVTIVMKSTVPPGTGEQLYAQFLANMNNRFHYISNPEFLREGQALRDWFCPDQIIIGGRDEQAIDMVRCLYSNITAPVLVTDITSAELIKYTANAFLATKVSFINEVAGLCECLGADIDLIAKGIGLDPRIGSGFLRAGIGYGGSCFPKDVRALDFLAKINGYNFELLKATINVNNRQRILPIHKLRQYLGKLSGKRIAILGLAFKPGTDDVRKSPALDIIRLLLDEGAKLRAYNPMATEKASRQFSSFEVEYCQTINNALNEVQAAIIATEWEEIVNYNWAEAKKLMQEPFVIIDGRNCLNPPNLIENGFCYVGVGRAIY